MPIAVHFLYEMRTGKNVTKRWPRRRWCRSLSRTVFPPPTTRVSRRPYFRGWESCWRPRWRTTRPWSAKRAGGVRGVAVVSRSFRLALICARTTSVIRIRNNIFYCRTLHCCCCCCCCCVRRTSSRILHTRTHTRTRTNAYKYTTQRYVGTLFIIIYLLLWVSVCEPCVRAFICIILFIVRTIFPYFVPRASERLSAVSGERRFST